MTYTITVYGTDRGLFAEVFEVPECCSTGETLDEVLAAVAEDVSFYAEVRTERVDWAG